MAKGLDIEFIRESYSRFSDQELLRIISQDAHGLTPEAVEVVKEELTKRRLDPKLANLVEAQNRDYTKEELDEICSIIEPLPCPKCKGTYSPLTAIMIYRTLGLVYITLHKKDLAIGCRNCLTSENNTAFTISILFGWWSPRGTIRTIQSIKNFFKASAALKETGPNDYFRDFILSNIGIFTLYKDDSDKIELIINNVHNGKSITTGLQ